MRVFALNVQHAGVRRVPLLAADILGMVPDVVVLSEFLADRSGLHLLELLRAGGLTGRAHGPKGSIGYPYTVAIASRLPMSTARVPFDGSAYATFVLEAEIGGVTVVGLYFPLGREHEPFWDQAFLPFTGTRRDDLAMIAGDWNTGSRTLDIGGKRVKGMAHFDSTGASGWTDAWRSLHPDQAEFSWYRQQSSNGFRLDHALLSESLAPRLLTSSYAHAPRASGHTDHSGLMIELR